MHGHTCHSGRVEFRRQLSGVRSLCPPLWRSLKWRLNQGHHTWHLVTLSTDPSFLSQMFSISSMLSSVTMGEWDIWLMCSFMHLKSFELSLETSRSLFGVEDWAQGHEDARQVHYCWAISLVSWTAVGYQWVLVMYPAGCAALWGQGPKLHHHLGSVLCAGLSAEQASIEWSPPCLTLKDFVICD